MQLLTVESVQPAKTGKSLRVKANGEWYGAKKDSGIASGMTIEAETEDGDFGKWINKWRPSNAAPQVAQPARAAVDAQASSRTPAVAAAWLPFASNTVAHAISAGYIKEPGHVSAWAKAAKEAFEALS